MPDVEERKGWGEGGRFWLREQQREGDELEGACVQGSASPCGLHTVLFQLEALVIGQIRGNEGLIWSGNGGREERGLRDTKEGKQQKLVENACY